MISTLQFIFQAQPSLRVCKSPVVLGRQKPLVPLANNDPPAVFFIGNHSQNHAGPAASRTMHFLGDEPGQIDA